MARKNEYGLLARECCDSSRSSIIFVVFLPLVITELQHGSRIWTDLSDIKAFSVWVNSCHPRKHPRVSRCAGMSYDLAIFRVKYQCYKRSSLDHNLASSSIAKAFVTSLWVGRMANVLAIVSVWAPLQLTLCLSPGFNSQLTQHCGSRRCETLWFCFKAYKKMEFPNLGQHCSEPTCHKLGKFSLVLIVLSAILLQ